MGSPSGATLTLTVRPDDAGDEPERASERFRRGVDATPGGSGIGPAIAEDLVAAGEGTVALHAAPSAAVDATVRFRSA